MLGEHVQHIIRHLTCPCGYTAMALMFAGRGDEVVIVLPHGAPEDGHRTGHLVQMHSICEQLFKWDEYVKHEN